MVLVVIVAVVVLMTIRMLMAVMAMVRIVVVAMQLMTVFVSCSRSAATAGCAHRFAPSSPLWARPYAISKSLTRISVPAVVWTW